MKKNDGFQVEAETRDENTSGAPEKDTGPIITRTAGIPAVHRENVPPALPGIPAITPDTYKEMIKKPPSKP